MRSGPLAVRLAALLVLGSISCSVTRAQEAGGSDVYRRYDSFASAMEALGSHDLCTVRSLGKTAGGRDVLLATVGTGEVDAKPAILVVGSAHAPHLLGSYLARQMAERLATDDEAAALLERTTFYFIPRPSPDATERNFGTPYEVVTTSPLPHDDDRDDRIDEDGPDDMNGDGRITMMRVKDPAGTWMPHEKDPRVLIQADRTKNEQGQYRLFTEGRDDDGDEQWNEDPVGGVAFDRNSTYKYPAFQPGAGPHAVSEPETRAVMDFAFERKNVAVVLCFTPDGNLEHVWKGNPQGDRARIRTTVHSEDGKYLEHLAEAYRELHEMKEPPKPGEPAGSFLEWAYFHYGRWAFGTRGWWPPKPEPEKKPEDEAGKNDAPGPAEGEAPAGEGAAGEPPAEEPEGAPDGEGAPETAEPPEAPETPEEAEAADEEPDAAAGDEEPGPDGDDPKKGDGKGPGKGKKKKEDKRGADEIRALQWLDASGLDGFVAWEKIDHPDFPGREVEVGGFHPRMRMNPPEDVAAKLVDANVGLLRLLAERLPRLEIVRDRVDDLGDGLYRIRVRLVNRGYLRTESHMGSTSRQLQRLQIDPALPEGAEVLTPPGRRGVGALDGNGGESEQTWLVRFGGSPPDTVSVRAWAPHVGEATLDVALEEEGR